MNKPQKNIIILGTGRTGKSTLAKKISKLLSYNLLQLDLYISAFEKAFPSLGIKHGFNDTPVAKKIAPFIFSLLEELEEEKSSETYYVIEGAHIDLELLLESFPKEQFLLIGLHHGNLSEENLFTQIRNHDTKKDWTYYLDDDELKIFCKKVIEQNNLNTSMFNKYGIINYDTSNDREAVFERIINELIIKL